MLTFVISNYAFTTTSTMILISDTGSVNNKLVQTIEFNVCDFNKVTNIDAGRVLSIDVRQKR